MKWPFRSLRWRIQTWHGLLLLTILTAFGSTGWLLVRENRLRQVDEELHQRVDRLASPLSRMGRGGGPRRFRGPPGHEEEFRREEHDHPPDWEREGERRPPPWAARAVSELLKEGADELVAAGCYYAAWDDFGDSLGSSANAPSGIPAPALSPGGTVRSRGSLREFHETYGGRVTVLVGRDLASIHQSLRRLAWLLVGAGAGVWALGLIGGWWVAHHALRPLDEISRTAETIAAGNLAERITPRDGDSELGRLSAVLNHTFDKLHETVERQAQFTADAAHELRTPVTILRSQAESILAKPRSPEEYREALEACQRAAERMGRLTESLLTLSRWDAGEQTLNVRPCDLAAVAKESLEWATPMAEKHGVELRLVGSSVECSCDPQAVSQVALNLLANAIVHNHPGGRVTVSTDQEDGFARLSVEDTGPGVAAVDQPRLFDRFYRADKSRSTARGGAGLGLAICKSIVEAHRGTIALESQPGQGAKFIARLPLAR